MACWLVSYSAQSHPLLFKTDINRCIYPKLSLTPSLIQAHTTPLLVHPGFCFALDEDLDKGLGHPPSSTELRHGQLARGPGLKKTREGVTQCNPPKFKRPELDITNRFSGGDGRGLDTNSMIASNCSTVGYRKLCLCLVGNTEPESIMDSVYWKDRCTTVTVEH